MKRLKLNEFEAIFNEKLSPYVADRIDSYSFEYEEFSDIERDQLLNLIVNTLFDPNTVKSGPHRKDEWESGWGENLDGINEDQSNIDCIVPKYFNKYGAIRWNGRFIKPLSEKFEYQSLVIILDWLFDKYFRDVDYIYEFGCGPAYHLLRAREVNSDAQLWGLDWACASQDIIKKIAINGIDSNIKGYNFDYFNPDLSFSIKQNSIIYTVASLEQVGDKWTKFIEYIIDEKPKLCVHVEPIAEMLDEDTLIDNLSIRYFKKRNYLEGFLDGLKLLESQGKLEIHETKRTHIGSLFIEGYSVVVWSPH
jgi:hypothetical protein